MIDFFYEDCDPAGFIDVDKLSKTTQIADCEGFILGGLTVVFCSDKHLLSINKEYLQHNHYTDIITFSYGTNEIISGDLFISIERVSENANVHKVSKEKELARVVIHGLLHLCGYNDKENQDVIVMRRKEEQYLKMIGFT
jgi:rRNA maturation RNase YbeY